MAALDTLPREEMMRSSDGMRGPPAIPMVRWRGRSRRVYVARIHDVRDLDPGEITRIVAVAVARGLGGTATHRDVVHGLDRAAARRWLDAMRDRGCGEIHVHRTTADADECRAIAADLGGGASR